MKRNRDRGLVKTARDSVEQEIALAQMIKIQSFELRLFHLLYEPAIKGDDQETTGYVGKSAVCQAKKMKIRSLRCTTVSKSLYFWCK